MTEQGQVEVGMKSPGEVYGMRRLPEGFGEVRTHVEFADGSELDLTITGPARTKRERVKMMTRLHAAQKAAVTGEDSD